MIEINSADKQVYILCNIEYYYDSYMHYCDMYGLPWNQEEGMGEVVDNRFHLYGVFLCGSVHQFMGEGIQSIF